MVQWILLNASYDQTLNVSCVQIKNYSLAVEWNDDKFRTCDDNENNDDNNTARLGLSIICDGIMFIIYKMKCELKENPMIRNGAQFFFTMSLTKALTIEKCFHAKYLNSRQQKLLNNWIPLQILKCEYNQKKNTAKTNELLLNAKEKNAKIKHCVLWHSSTPRTWIFISANEVQSNTHKLNYRMLHGSDAHWHIHSDTIINHVFKCNPIRLRKRSFDCFDLNFSFFGLICYVCR